MRAIGGVVVVLQRLDQMEETARQVHHEHCSRKSCDVIWRIHRIKDALSKENARCAC